MGSGIGLLPAGTKPLLEPMLMYHEHRRMVFAKWWPHYSELALKSPSRRSPLHRRVGHRSTGLGWLTAGWWFMALPLRNKLISTDKSKIFFCRFNSNFIFINTMVFDFFFHSDFVFQSSKSVAYQWRDFFWSQLQICRASCSIRARWRLA